MLTFLGTFIYKLKKKRENRDKTFKKISSEQDDNGYYRKVAVVSIYILQAQYKHCLTTDNDYYNTILNKDLIDITLNVINQVIDTQFNMLNAQCKNYKISLKTIGT